MISRCKKQYTLEYVTKLLDDFKMYNLGELDPDKIPSHELTASITFGQFANQCQPRITHVFADQNNMQQHKQPSNKVVLKNTRVVMWF